MYLQRVFIIFVIIIIVVISVMQVFQSINTCSKKTKVHYTAESLQKYKSDICCYEATDLESMEDISDLPRPPANSMFFHETSCRSYSQRRLVLNARQACAVESAAVTNPNRSVYLLFTSPGALRPEFAQPADLLLMSLQSYSNVHILHANYAKYIADTPVQHLYTTGKIARSKFPLAHASDIMRFLTLYKFGGVYIDLDFVVMKPLDDLGPNFAGMESQTNANAAFMGLSSSPPGHTWANWCLEDLKKTFTGQAWADSSVGVMSRLVRHLCNTTEITVDNATRNCAGFKVAPSKLLYPISYYIWPDLFNPARTEQTMKAVKDSYSLHLWNKLSHGVTVGPEPNYAYAKLANRFCPKVFAAVGGRMIPSTSYVHTISDVCCYVLIVIHVML